MIRKAAFWSMERDAPLLNRNAGYIQPDKVESALLRAQDWLGSVESKGQVVVSEWKTVCASEECQRIFQLDAERTFKAPQHRQDMVETLCTIHQEIKDYHQGMGFIVAFLLLFLEKEQVANLVIGLDKYYVEGYFKTAPVAYVRDARTFERILQKEFPKVHQHITCLVPPEAYCSKWFVGFNVHVLPFPALADFLDAFFASDDFFRFQYALALVRHTQHDILKTSQVGRVLECLRLDAAHYPDHKVYLTEDTDSTPGSFFTQIVQDARDYCLDHIDLEAIRQDVMEELAKETLQRQLREQQLSQDQDEIVFSDED